MNLDELRKKFIVGDDFGLERLAELVERTHKLAVVDQKGTVHLRARQSGTTAIKTVLVARALAAMLDESISADVDTASLEAAAKVPAPQVRARMSELIRTGAFESPSPGIFRAVRHRIESSLDDLARDGKEDVGDSSSHIASRRKVVASKKNTSTSMGPKAALARAYSQGFFSVARTLADIVVHIDRNFAVRAKQSDLSGALARYVRSGKLNRAKNAENQYEYVQPKA